MHPLIERAKNTIAEWSSDHPHDLSLSVATLCREILDDGELPNDLDWQRLRQSFDIERGQSIASTILEWDELCRLGDFDISDHDAFVKLGIVTWTVKLLLKHLGMLSGPPAPKLELEAWKSNLIECLDKYIIVN